MNVVKWLRDVVATFVVVFTIAVTLYAIAAVVANAESKADTGIGCESIRWGFLGTQYRTICDGPKRADGSWERVRRIWTPAGWRGGGCYGYYFYTCYPDRYYDEVTTGLEKYVVFDYNVLPDEPGWLPGGTVVIR